jgi:hypothetical protein
LAITGALAAALAGCAEAGGSSAVVGPGGGSRTAATVIAEALRPDDVAPPSVVGSWMSSVGWSAGEAESGPGSIRTTHKFSSTVSTSRGKQVEAGQYEIEEVALDVPSRGCRHTTTRRGTFELDARILTVTLTEGSSVRTCPGVPAVSRVMKDKDGAAIVQTYEAQLSGDTLTLRSILAGATLSPIVFRRDGQ